jgi:hypothetical protein
MFTGFASENTPAIQVWDFFITFASTSAVRSISLADDCAPIQVFRTGATSTDINLYLPTAPIEGKQIKIINSRHGGTAQKIAIYASDVSGSGNSQVLVYVGVGQTIDFCYSKNCISFGSTGGSYATGWITLNQASAGATNSNAAVSGGSACSATGGGSFVGGGSSCSASGGQSFVGGGSSNLASAFTSAVIGGSGNTASNSYASVVSGENNTAGGYDSAVIGGSTNTVNSTSDYGLVLSGTSNTTSSAYGTVINGAYGTTRAIIGNTVLPASVRPIAASAGVQQSAVLVLGVATTNATATVLRSNTSAAGTTNQVILPDNSAYTFQGTCIANVTGGSTTSGWKYEGVIKRGAGVGTTTLVAAVTPTVIAQDVAAATWVLAITADTTNGGIAVTVTGAAATTIRWVSRIETTEVTF